MATRKRGKAKKDQKPVKSKPIEKAEEAAAQSPDILRDSFTESCICRIMALLAIGKIPVQLQVGARYWAESPDNGPEDFGVRAGLTLLFPK